MRNPAFDSIGYILPPALSFRCCMCSFSLLFACPGTRPFTHFGPYSVRTTFVISGDEFENIDLITPTKPVTDPSAASPHHAGNRGTTFSSTAASPSFHMHQQRNSPSPYHSAADVNSNMHFGGKSSPGSVTSQDGGGDMLREMVKNKEIMRAPRGTLQKYNSIDSDVSDGSTLVCFISQLY